MSTELNSGERFSPRRRAVSAKANRRRFLLVYPLIVAVLLGIAMVGNVITGQNLSNAALQSADGIANVAVLEQSGATDSIVLHELSRGGERTIYQAANIVTFALNENALAVVTTDGDGQDLRLISLSDNSEHDVTLPGEGRVTQLRAGTGTMFGFAFTSRAIYAGNYQSAMGSVYESALMFVSLDTTTPVMATNLSGDPISASGWRFVPGSNSVIAQGWDYSVWLFSDAANPTRPAALGEATVYALIPETTKLVEFSEKGLNLLDLSTGKTEAVTLPNYSDNQNLGFAELQVINEQMAYLDVSTSSSDVYEVDSSGSSTLFSTSGGRRVQSVCLSTDGTKVAITSAPYSSTISSSASASSPDLTNTVVDIVDLNSGRDIASLSAGLPDWCNR